MTGSFVWVRGHNGNPRPEKWPDDAPSGVKKESEILPGGEHKLSAAEFALPIAILEQRYPPPKSAAQ